MPAARDTNPPPTQVLPPAFAAPQPTGPSRRSSPLPIIIAVAGVVVLAGALILFFALRRPATSSSTTSSSSTVSSSPTRTSSPTVSSTPTETHGSLSTPTETYRTAYNAIKNKDVAAFKRVLTKEDAKTMDEAAQQTGQTSDEMLKLMMAVMPMPSSVETRNEEIDGDTATLEVKNADGEWETVDFVKEEGEWKMK